MMSETNNQKLIMLALGKLRNVKIFRNNTGSGWVGKYKWAKDRKGIFIEDPRPLKAGLCVGSSDLIGWTELEITPDMVGKKIAVFTAIEVKKNKNSTKSKEQINFLNQLRMSGGISGFAETDEQVINIIKNSF